MERKVLWNIAVNLFFSIVFITLNINAVNRNYEESFIGYAVIYSFIAITVNAFLSKYSK